MTREQLLKEICARGDEIEEDALPLSTLVMLDQVRLTARRDPLTREIAVGESAMLRRCALDCAAWALLALEKLDGVEERARGIVVRFTQRVKPPQDPLLHAVNELHDAHGVPLIERPTDEHVAATHAALRVHEVAMEAEVSKDGSLRFRVVEKP